MAQVAPASQNVPKSNTAQSIEVKKNEMFNFTVQDDEVIVELTKGTAEVFGSEMAMNKKYAFYGGAGFGVYSTDGCTLSVEGKVKSESCEAKQMEYYKSFHEKGLKPTREEAKSSKVNGPRVMICGPVDVGKSTLCKILLNYATRDGCKPMFVDLDVGQGAIGIVGCMGVIVVEKGTDVNDGFSQDSPFMFQFGHNAPDKDLECYNGMISRLAVAADAKAKADEEIKSSGIIINTCGWVKEGGFEALLHAANVFQVDKVIVMAKDKNDNLFRDLVAALPKSVMLFKVSQLDGVSDKANRLATRQKRIDEYFYGIFKYKVASSSTYPFDVEIPHQDLIERIFARKDAKSSGKTLKFDWIERHFCSIKPTDCQAGHTLGLMFATKESLDALGGKIEGNVQGFVYVKDNDRVGNKLVFMSPQKEIPKDCIFFLV
ncbi:Protein CLP1 -like protein [Halotydeus destructor]|nr:Protein CLP1 -like protein [Halotydeus destructor]